MERPTAAARALVKLVRVDVVDEPEHRAAHVPDRREVHGARPRVLAVVLTGLQRKVSITCVKFTEKKRGVSPQKETNRRQAD